MDPSFVYAGIPPGVIPNAAFIPRGHVNALNSFPRAALPPGHPMAIAHPMQIPVMGRQINPGNILVVISYDTKSAYVSKRSVKSSFIL